MAGDLLPTHLRGTGYGVLAMVNGVGDLISSFAVGLLWTKVSPIGFSLRRRADPNGRCRAVHGEKQGGTTGSSN